jgi:hypothetical protein
LLANGIIRRASDGAAELLGAGADVIFKPLRAFIAVDDVERLYRHIQQCLVASPQRPRVETDLNLNPPLDREASGSSAGPF